MIGRVDGLIERLRCAEEAVSADTSLLFTATHVKRYFERVSKAFHTALSNARRAGELRRAVDPRGEAAFFTASVLGLFVMLRAKAPPSVIESASRVATDHLDALCAESPT